ncbi:condensation domain-containing protein, partial [Algoriphagus boritolerans]|uniref:condensation domain-containing protein n=1 Tax=Algoriphagus boritolerans TaxID=308111 RepID=UPI000A473B5E
LKNWGSKPFDLSRPPLIRMEIWQTERQQFLLIDTHHIIMDGMSYGPFFRALCDAYQGKSLSAEPLSFIDYAYWQQSAAQRLVQAEQAEFWHQMFAQGLPVLELPADFPMPTNRTFEGGLYSFSLERELFDRIQGFCKEIGSTPYMLLYAAFSALLGKIAQTDDVVVSTTSSGRNLPETEDMIGMFVNTLAIRTKIDSIQSFEKFLEASKQLLLTSFEHDSYPYEELIAGLRSRQLGDNAVRVMFTMMKEHELYHSLGESSIKMVGGGESSQAKFDLTFSGTENVESIDFEIEYAAELFSGESIKRLADRFINLLSYALETPECTLGALPVLLEDEEKQLKSWNNTDMEVPKATLIHELFEQKVCEYPDKTALVFKEEELSYSELNQKANRLAHYLRSCGIGAERRVG